MGTLFRSWSPQKTYLLASSTTSTIALGLSFIYSRELGANNRGIVGMIFLISLLYSTVALGGLNLTFKSQRKPISAQTHLKAFIFISFPASFIGSIITVLVAIVYSNLKTIVPTNLLVMGGIYSLFSVTLNQLFQIILARGLTSLKWKLDLTMVLIQTLLYFLLRNTSDISIAVCILLSFTFSYALLILLILLLVVNIKIISSEDSNKGFIRVKELMLASKSNIGYSISMGILDRMDRIIVLILFPANIYGVYSYLTGMIAFSRFIPDSISTLIVAKKTLIKINVSTIFQKILFLAISAFFGVTAYLITEKTFYEGNIVLLWVAIFFSFSELLRATYISGMSHLFERSGNKTPFWSAMFLLLFFSFIGTISVQFFGLLGIPFALTFSYLVVLPYLNRREFQLD
jgi:hypothetical protein